MSTREQLIQRAAETLDATPGNWRGHLTDQEIRAMAETVVDAVLPQITKPEQLAGVSEGSILFVERDADTFFYTWRGEQLHNLGGAGGFIPEYILRWGPLTVVWQP